jgi:Tol biopolymer transport system component
MKVIWSMSLLALLFLLTGCAENVVIDYTPVYVPQESGYQFTKITDESDQLVTWIEGLPANFDISKTEDKVVFVGYNSNKTRSLFVKNMENLKIKQQRTFSDLVSYPAFSPDGSKLAFTDFKNDLANIYLIGADKGVAVQQITQSGNSIEPFFSNDGKELFYVGFERKNVSLDQFTYNYTIWSYSLDKATLTQYGSGQQPNFFPGTNKVSIVRNDQLWIFDLDSGAEYSLLADPNMIVNNPRVSPDGKKIVFQAWVKTAQRPNWDLYVINSDGTSLSQITFHQGNDMTPRWGKDGSNIYFVSQRGNAKGDHNIWKIKVE